MGQSASLFNRQGFEYIGKENEIANQNTQNEQNTENIEKMTAENLKIGDVVKLSPTVLIGSNDKEIIFPSEYGVVTDINNNIISFQTYSDKELQNSIAKAGQSISAVMS